MIGVVMSFVVAVPITQSRFMESVQTDLKETSIGERSGIEERIQIYQLFGTMAIERPLFGHGLMSGVKFQGALPKMDLQSIYLDIRSPHNTHLQIIFDLGAVGAILMLVSLIWPIWRWHISGNHSQALAALLAVALVLEGALFNFVIWRTWVLGAATLTFYFLLINVPKTRLSEVR